jgi:hypothetical protein
VLEHFLRNFFLLSPFSLETKEAETRTSNSFLQLSMPMRRKGEARRRRERQATFFCAVVQ